MGTRICNRCGEEYGMDRFPRYYKNGEMFHRMYCINCKTSDAMAWYNKNKEKVAEYRAKILRRKRAIVLEAYGNKCACCGENTPEFLSIDHVNGGGGKARKSGKERTGSALYHKIIKLDFPKDYRVLCHNCNMAKGIYGMCPHEKERLLLDFHPSYVEELAKLEVRNEHGH